MLPAVYLSQEYFDANWQTSNPWHAAAKCRRIYKQLCFVLGFCFDEILTIIIKQLKKLHNMYNITTNERCFDFRKTSRNIKFTFQSNSLTPEWRNHFVNPKIWKKDRIFLPPIQSKLIHKISEYEPHLARVPRVGHPWVKLVKWSNANTGWPKKTGPNSNYSKYTGPVFFGSPCIESLHSGMSLAWIGCA